MRDLCSKCEKSLTSHSRYGKKVYGLKYCSAKCRASAAQRRWYLKYPNRLRVRDKENKRVLEHKASMQWFMDKIKSVPCLDCNQSFPPVCMDFDHIDPSTKKERIAKIWNDCCLKRNPSYVALIREMAKCEIVCSNCHRIRTQQRQQRLM